MTKYTLTAVTVLFVAIMQCSIYSKATAAAQGDSTGSVKDVLTNKAITTEQKNQLQAVLKAHETMLASLTRSYSKEKNTLAQLINAEPLDEAAIRAQFTKAAEVGAEITVVNAKLRKQLRAVLTAEQLASIAKIKSDAGEASLDRLLLRLAAPVGNR